MPQMTSQGASLTYSFCIANAFRQISAVGDVQAFPRINSKGSLCGAVYRVASESNMGDLNLMG